MNWQNIIDRIYIEYASSSICTTSSISMRSVTFRTSFILSCYFDINLSLYTEDIFKTLFKKLTVLPFKPLLDLISLYFLLYASFTGLSLAQYLSLYFKYNVLLKKKLSEICLLFFSDYCGWNSAYVLFEGISESAGRVRCSLNVFRKHSKQDVKEVIRSVMLRIYFSYSLFIIYL